jgi:hypothetical protein
LIVCQTPVRVDVDGGPPVLLGQFPGFDHRAHDTGVGDHDVQPAELGRSAADCRLHRGELTDVGLHRDDPAAVLAHQRRGLLQVRERRPLVRDGLHRLADVDRDDVRPLLGEPDRLGASLPASGTGDEGHLAVYQAHSISLR